MSCVFFLRVEFFSLIENLFLSGHCIKYISLFIYHTQIKLLLVDRANGETRFGTAEFCTFDGFYLACEGGGGVDHIVNIASRYTDMLEVVDMTADVHIYVVLAQNAVYAFLHVKPLAFFFRSVGIDGVVTSHDDPVFLGACQHRFQP